MKIVLHICCGVCSASVVEQLAAEGHEIWGLFYNPNIQPAEEYERRLEAARKAAGELNFPLTTVLDTAEEWLRETRGLENEPEGGKRCTVCYRLRLKKTYLYLLEQGGDAFTTTLTVSRTKSAAVINQIGQDIDGDRFMPRDFKKKNGFERSAELAGKWGLYRQHYCGCLYSGDKTRINRER